MKKLFLRLVALLSLAAVCGAFYGLPTAKALIIQPVPTLTFLVVLLLAAVIGRSRKSKSKTSRNCARQLRRRVPRRGFGSAFARFRMITKTPCGQRMGSSSTGCVSL